jgi:hypothetical protein
MIYLNKFDTPKGMMVAMCDEELMGRVLKEGRIEIDLKRYGGFYKGELVSEAEASSIISKNVYSANVVGDRSVGILIAKGIVNDNEVRNVEGVKFVHLFKVRE